MASSCKRQSEKRPFPFPWKESHEETVIEQKERKDENQIIQEGIVSRKNDADLPRRHDQEKCDSKTARQKGQPNQDQFERQGEECCGALKPVRKMLYVPADPSW